MKLRAQKVFAQKLTKYLFFFKGLSSPNSFYLWFRIRGIVYSSAAQQMLSKCDIIAHPTSLAQVTAA